jgi:integrase
LGQRPIGEIEAIDVLDTLRQVEKRGALEIAKRLAQNCGQVFRYAIATGRAQRNPVPDLKGALKPMKPGHFAALDLKELPDFIDKLNRNDARLYPLTRLAIRLMMLTFVRTSELIEARWQEFDLEGAQWVIPAERMKMRRPHVVPLSPPSGSHPEGAATIQWSARLGIPKSGQAQKTHEQQHGAVCAGPPGL